MRTPSVLSLVHYVVALVLAGVIVVIAGDIAHTHQTLANILSPEARTEAAWQKVLETLSLGLYEGAEAERERIALLNNRILLLWERANLVSLGLFAWSGAFLAWQRWRSGPRSLMLHVLASAGVCLAIGLVAPMLSIVAQREVPMLGQVVLRYESKAILSTVWSLAAKGHWLVAVPLMLTSVLIPIAKLGLAFVASLGDGATHRRCQRLLHAVGRWSLTDVFVVAVLLAFMAGDAGDSTDAWIGHGLWFFAAYAALSWLVSQRLEANSRAAAADSLPRPQAQ